MNYEDFSADEPIDHTRIIPSNFGRDLQGGCDRRMFALEMRDIFDIYQTLGGHPAVQFEKYNIHAGDCLYTERKPVQNLEAEIAKFKLALQLTEATNEDEEFQKEVLANKIARLESEELTGLTTGLADAVEALLRPKRTVTTFDISYNFTSQFRYSQDGNTVTEDMSVSNNETYEIENILNTNFNQFESPSQFGHISGKEKADLEEVKESIEVLKYENRACEYFNSTSLVLSGRIWDREEYPQSASREDQIRYLGAQHGLTYADPFNPHPYFCYLADTNVLQEPGTDFNAEYPYGEIVKRSDGEVFPVDYSYEVDQEDWRWIRNEQDNIRQGIAYYLPSFDFRFGYNWIGRLRCIPHVANEFDLPSDVITEGKLILDSNEQDEFYKFKVYLQTLQSGLTLNSSATIENFKIEVSNWDFKLIKDSKELGA